MNMNENRIRDRLVERGQALFQAPRWGLGKFRVLSGKEMYSIIIARIFRMVFIRF